MIQHYYFKKFVRNEALFLSDSAGLGYDLRVCMNFFLSNSPGHLKFFISGSVIASGQVVHANNKYLSFSCIMLKNDQSYFSDLAVFTLQTF